MKNFNQFDEYMEELILGAQGDWRDNVKQFCLHLGIEVSDIKCYLLELLGMRKCEDDWGNLGENEDGSLSERSKIAILDQINAL